MTKEPEELPEPASDRQAFRQYGELLEGTMSEEAFADFQDKLSTDAEFRRGYLQFVNLDSALPDELERLAWLESDDPQSKVDRGHSIKGPARLIAKWSNWVPLLAAAIACVSLSLHFMPAPRRYDPSISMIQSTEILPVPIKFASITQSIDADWHQAWYGQLLPWSNATDALASGPLWLSKGLLEITFDHGATFIVEGPTKLELLDSQHIRVESGQLCIHALEDSQAVSIRTLSDQIVDLQGEAGIRVGPNSGLEVHLFSGKAEMRSLAIDAGKATLEQKLEAGSAGRVVSYLGQRRFERFDAQEDGFVFQIGSQVIVDPASNRTETLNHFGSEDIAVYSTEPDRQMKLESRPGSLYGRIEPQTKLPQIGISFPQTIDLQTFRFLRLSMVRTHSDETSFAFTPGDKNVDTAVAKAVFLPTPRSFSYQELSAEIPFVDGQSERGFSRGKLTVANQVGNLPRSFQIDYLMVDRYPTIGIAEFDADNYYGKLHSRSIKQATISDGIFRGTSADDDPYLLSYQFQIDADKYNAIEVRMKATAKANFAKIYWGKKGNALGEDKHVVLPKFADDKFHTYLINMTGATDWNDTINYLRLDPCRAAEQSFEIDYIRALSIPESDYDEIDRNSRHPTLTTRKVTQSTL